MYESMEGLCVEITDKDRNCVILRAKCFCNLTSKRFDHSKLYDWILNWQSKLAKLVEFTRFNRLAMGSESQSFGLSLEVRNFRL